MASVGLLERIDKVDLGSFTVNNPVSLVDDIIYVLYSDKSGPK
jgi:hypothetical protein